MFKDYLIYRHLGVGLIIVISIVVAVAVTTVAVSARSAEHLLAAACRALLLGSFVGEEVASAIDDAAADPHFHADAAVGGVSLHGSVVNVGTKGVQRDTAVFEVLGTGDFGAAETTGHGHLDTLSLGAHGGGDSGLHR